MALETVDIEEKVDSPEKLAQVQSQGILSKYVIFASNFNKIRERVNQLVAAFNKKTPALNNTDDEFPTSKAVLSETDKKITKAEKDELEVVSAVDVNDVDPKGKGLLFFKNAITITGIKATGLYEGQEFFIMNGSAGTLTIANMSNNSSPGNRIYLQSGQNLSMKPNGVIRLRYSTVRTRFEVITSFGVDMLASLAYAGNEQRVVTINHEGVVFAEPIMNFQVFDNNVDGYANLNAIVAVYPSNAGNKKGFQVVCGQMAQPTLYIKGGDGDDNWMKFVGVKLV